METFLPTIHNGPTVPVQGEADPDRAWQVFERMANHPDQGREVLTWDEQLAEAAERKCRVQARDGWDGHVDPYGDGPNKWVRIYTDYKLPDPYSHADAANNCESLAHNGDGSVEGVWDAWMHSPGHRAHILGENSFYAGQTQVGIGFYEGGPKRFYWCILSVHPEAN